MRSINQLAVALALSLPSAAFAAPAVTIGDAPSHQLANVNPLQSDVIDVFYDTTLSGGGFFKGQTIYISVADEGNGGNGTADPGEPYITAVDGLTGTVWAPNNTGFAASAINNQLWQYDITTATGSINGTGKLMSVTINRNNAPAGSIWGLRVFVGVPYFIGPYASNWSAGTNIGVPFSTADDADGWNGVTGVPDGAFQYVPEPSSIALAAFALIGLAAAAWRKRRKV